MEDNDTYNQDNVTMVFPDITMFEFITEGVVLTVLGVMGILGNIISLIILSKPEMRASVNCGLQGLAFFDTIVLISSVTMLGLHKLGYKMFILYRYTFEIFPFVVMVAYPIGLIAQTGSVWTTVGVTVERYVAVCHPLKARFLCTYRRARVFNILIVVFAVCYNIPRFWEIDVREVLDPYTNTSGYVARPSEFRMNKLYYKVYYIWLYLFVMYFIPFLTLAVLNIFIWKAVQHANKDRQRLTRREEKEIGLAMMLICVVAIFFVCNILALLINILECFDIVIPALVRVSNLLVTFNSSINFVIYCIFGQKFKKMFLHMFCGFRRSKNQSFTSTLQVTHTETLRSVAPTTSRAKSLTSNGNSQSSIL
ncbi:FMRFamide receptor-like [Uloborus diversus]|uniref:FMRFamide receptor-like n=1 Tax=Uloborus diversus TaxID=327109 RepID=UPI002409DA77|nr:FMRFamide receptor-like [Uloborus diversus]